MLELLRQLKRSAERIQTGKFPVHDHEKMLGRGTPNTGNACLGMTGLVLIALSNLIIPAHAGSYSVSYSGGATNYSGSNSGSQSSTAPYSVQPNGYYGSGGGGNWGSNYDPTTGKYIPYSGYSRSEGEITATFNWQSSGLGDDPPSKVVIEEESKATYSSSGQNSSPSITDCDNGLEFPNIRTTNSPPNAPYVNVAGGSTGTRYKIKSDPGISFSITCSPTATLEGTGASTYGGSTGGSARVNYRATATPLEIVLSGGIGEDADKSYLIGQLVTATVTSGGLPASSFDWEVSGGEPFKKWEYDNSESTLTELGSETNSELTFHFKKPDSATIETPVHLSVPFGAVPASGLNVTLEADCIVDKPTQDLRIIMGQVVGIEDASDPEGIGLRKAIYKDPNNFDPGYLGVTNGIFYVGTVNDPVAYSNAYGEDGTWCYAQIVNVGRDRTRLAGSAILGEGLAYNGLPEVLDSGFPYQASFDANGLEQADSDGPGEFISDFNDYLDISIDESFETNSMYKPPGAGSCYVPLKNFTWNWGGDLDYNSSSNIWILSNPSAGSGIGGDYPPFPVWSKNVRDAANTWQ